MTTNRQPVYRSTAKGSWKNIIQTAAHLGEKLCDKLEQVGTLGRTAARKLDDALADSASNVREAGEAIDELAEKAAVQLDATAAYVRSYYPACVLMQLRQIVRRRPAIVVAGAAAAGFLIGLAVRRKWRVS